MAKKKGYVYLLCDTLNEGVYKIGVTKGSLENRIKKLQTGNPGEIYLCDSHETDIPFFIEKHLHLRFSSKKEIGEWYRLTNEESLSFRKICNEIEEMYEIMKDNFFFKKLKIK